MMTKVALLDCRVCMQDLPLRKVTIVSQSGLPAAACHVPSTGLALRRMPPTATPSPASTQWVDSQASARQPIAQPMMFAMAMLAAVVSTRALRLPDGAAFSSYCCSSVACTGPSVTLPMWPNAVALRTRSSLVGLSVQVVLSVP